MQPDSLNLNLYLHKQISSNQDLSPIFQIKARRIMKNFFPVGDEKVIVVAISVFKTKVNVKHKCLS